MAEPKENLLMEKIVSLCKRRGFIYQSSEIYGGINGFWDYGPLGAELKRNLRDAWWHSMMRQREDVVGLDASIITHPIVWKASGHVDTFADPMSTCKSCKKLIRADQVFGMIWESKWGQSLAAAVGTGGEGSTMIVPPSFQDSPLAKWIAHTAKKEVPDLAVVRNRDTVLPEIEKRLTIPLTQAPWPNFRELVCLLGGDGFDPDKSPVPPCPHCGGEMTPPRPFNLMLQTHYGPIASDENLAYLRPETAQAIFVQFKNVFDSSRVKVPFGIGQIGKAFRNEITPRNFTFRSREFEQMELEFFIRPDEATEALHGSVATVPPQGHPGEPQPNWGWQAWHQYWVEERVCFYENIGLSRDTLGFHIQQPDELAHYARATVDILYKFPFSKEEDGVVKGDELEGIAARGDFDLSQHEKFSGKPLGVFDEEVRAAWTKLPDARKQAMREEFIEAKTRTGIDKKKLAPSDAAEAARKEADGFFEKLAKGQFVPHVIEPSAGLDRLTLALLCNAFTEITDTDDKGKSETRVVMKFHPRVAPIKVAVLPLLKNKPDLVKKAQAVRDLLRPHMNVFYDDGGSIGRRYARQDEAGTPFCLTIDFDTLGEKPELLDTVTLRYRDDGRQERLPIAQLKDWLLERIR